MGEAALAIADRSREFWTPQSIWKGATVFILGGGPSLRDFDARCLDGRCVLAINESVFLCPTADALYFQDGAWFKGRRSALREYRGLVLTVSREAKRLYPDEIKRLCAEDRKDFLPEQPTIKAGRSSGHTAVSVAVSSGPPARIVLLGYDMHSDGGRTHYHDAYSEPDEKIYAKSFIPSFNGWRAAAEKVGVEVINATPGSALAEFRTMNIGEVLR